MQIRDGATGWPVPLLITKQGDQLPLLVAALVAGGVVQGDTIKSSLKVEDRIVMVKASLSYSFLP